MGNGWLWQCVLPIAAPQWLLIGQRLLHAAESIKGRAFIGFDLDAKV
jgi:hypothetical protein